MSFSFKHLGIYPLLACIAFPIMGCQNTTSGVSQWGQGIPKDTNYIKELLSRADSIEIAPLNLDSVLRASDIKMNLSDVDYKLLNSIDPNVDSAMLISELALKLSEELNFNYGIAESLINIGGIYEKRGNYFQADQCYNKALKQYRSSGDLYGISRVQSELGFLYGRLKDRETAIDYYTKALENAKSSDNSERLSRAILDLGQMYSYDLFSPTAVDRESLDKAIAVFLEARSIFEKLEDPMRLHISNLELGKIYLQQNKPEQALQYLFEAREYQFDIPWGTLNLIARAHLKLGHFEEAKEYYGKALTSSLEENGFGELEAYMGLGQVHMKLNAPLQSTDYFKKILANAEITGDPWVKQKALRGLSEAYYSLEDYKSATLTYHELAAIRDTLVSDLSNPKKDVTADLREFNKRIYENQKLEFELQKQEEEESKRLLYVGLGIFLLVSCGLTNRYLYIRKVKKKISKEKDRSDEILLNILPEETARELKEKGSIKAKQFDQITVLFTDFKGFSLIAEKIAPEQLVDSVDYYFKHFDVIIEKHGLEKIKTIGDSYMCAGGIPSPNSTHAEDAMKAALEIRDFVAQTKKNPPPGIYPFEMRIGLNTGPVVAGVVGTKKFAYDIWGSTVNFAARMEAKSEPGKINVSESTFNLLKDKYKFEYRGEVEVKNGQILKMYFALPEMY